MTPKPDPLAPVALSALSLPLPGAGGAAPSEIMLLPAPLWNMRTVDGRGPFRLSDVDGLIARSMGQPRNGGKLPIDVNHATEKLGALGMEAPARGWITGLSARDDGIWAQVEWTEAGRAMVAAREYLSISPVIMRDAKGVVTRILGASLTNDPALLGLATLTTRETPMNDLLARLAQRLGKPETSTAEELLTAVPDPAAAVMLTALQGEVTALCSTLGVKDIGGARAAVDALRAGVANVETLTAKVTALETASQRQAAEAWMAGEIAAKRGIPADKREGLIEMFCRDADQAKSVAALYPALGAALPGGGAPAGVVVTLTAEQAQVARTLAVSDADFLKSLNAKQEAR
jgi:phage I-like protein